MVFLGNFSRFLFHNFRFLHCQTSPCSVVDPKLQRPFKEEVEKVIGELLFEGNIEEAKETIYKMWTKREKRR